LFSSHLLSFAIEKKCSTFLRNFGWYIS
jgi:hypothetical protein